MPSAREGSDSRWHPALRLLVFLAATAGATVVLAYGLAWLLAGTAPAGATGLALPHAVIAVATLTVSLSLYRWFDGDPRPDFALGLPLSSAAFGPMLKGGAFGAALITAAVLVQLVVGWLRPMTQAGGLGDWLGHMGVMAILFAIGSASEELLFRGYGFQRLLEWLGTDAAVLIQALLFGFLHVGNPRTSPLPLLNIGLAGVLLAGAYLWTRSLWAAIGLHWSWNWFTALFDRPISGISFDAPGYDLRELGPDLMTGGSFGPEGGLLTTLILIAAIALMFTAMRRRAGEGAGAGAIGGDGG